MIASAEHLKMEDVFHICKICFKNNKLSNYYSLVNLMNLLVRVLTIIS